MKGGAGAADHAISTYGGINEQRAMGPHDNTIAMKHMNGGRVRNTKKSRGGQWGKPKSHKRGGSRKRKTRKVGGVMVCNRDRRGKSCFSK